MVNNAAQIVHQHCSDEILSEPVHHLQSKDYKLHSQDYTLHYKSYKNKSGNVQHYTTHFRFAIYSIECSYYRANTLPRLRSRAKSRASTR